MTKATAGTIDQYIADFPPETRAILQKVRQTIQAVAPEATETISYGIPTFDWHGKHLIHFAGWKTHIGLYPTPSGITHFSAELTPYVHDKGSVRFPIDRPMPYELIERMVRFRVNEQPTQK